MQQKTIDVSLRPCGVYMAPCWNKNRTQYWFEYYDYFYDIWLYLHTLLIKSISWEEKQLKTVMYWLQEKYVSKMWLETNILLLTKISSSGIHWGEHIALRGHHHLFRWLGVHIKYGKANFSCILLSPAKKTLTNGDVLIITQQTAQWKMRNCRNASV